MKFFLALLLAASWHAQDSGVTASLRGVSAVSSRVAWASGTGGTWLRTVDGGATWKPGIVPGAEKLDFRGLHALDENIAFLLSSGPGDQSRVFQTTDGGGHWTPLFTNPDPKGFLDAISFWDAKHGIIAGDPVGGAFAIFTTTDAGHTWTRHTTATALPGEGAFAASNSCLTVEGKSNAWLGTGGPGGGRILHSSDGGATWRATRSGIRNDSESAGVFSIALSNKRIGIAVGGDYRKDSEGQKTVSRTTDGGRTWKSIDGPGYRSSVLWLPGRKLWIATGASGSDVSSDGVTWKTFDAGSYNAMSVSRDGTLWAVGPKGRISEFAE